MVFHVSSESAPSSSQGLEAALPTIRGHDYRATAGTAGSGESDDGVDSRADIPRSAYGHNGVAQLETSD